VAEGPNPVGARSHFDPVAAPKVARLTGDDRVLTNVNDLLDLDPPRLPHSVETLQPPPDAFGGFVHPSPLVQFARRVVPAVRGRVAQGRIPVAPVESCEYGLDDLHVLLRHRLLSKSGGFEGLLLGREGSRPEDPSVPHLVEPGCNCV